MCLASRTYALLVEALGNAGELSPNHGMREADRAVSRVFGVARSTARNWRRCRHHHVAHATAVGLVERCREVSPEHAPRLEFLGELARGGQSLGAAAERLVRSMSDLAGGGVAWHIYAAPLSLAFSLEVSARERAQWVERSSLLVDRIHDAGLDHTDVPCLPELVRYSLHSWHHASRFDVRERTLADSWSESWLSYLNRIERALYFGDVRAMPALFSGRVEEAAEHTRVARDLLACATREDIAQSHVGIAEAHDMIDAVEAQILVCHGDGSDIERAVERFERTAADHPWIDSVRCGAMGYARLLQRRYGDAFERFSRAAAQVDAWLQRSGIAFGSSPHLALAGFALRRAGGTPERARAVLVDALHRSVEHDVIVDQIVARRCMEHACRAEGKDLETRHHASRADALVAAHGLDAWDEVLGRLLR